MTDYLRHLSSGEVVGRSLRSLVGHGWWEERGRCGQAVSASFFEQVLQTGQIELQNVLHWALMKLAYSGLVEELGYFEEGLHQLLLEARRVGVGPPLSVPGRGR